MNATEFRAYDKKEKALIYNSELWLPEPLRKFGHTVNPVHITEDGVHYTLNCLSNHYEDDWEEDVVAHLGIEIMPFTNLWDHGESRKKIYANDIISFSFKSDSDLHPGLRTGRVTYSQEFEDWVLVDKQEQLVAKLSEVERLHVIGNWFDDCELLG